MNFFCFLNHIVLGLYLKVMAIFKKKMIFVKFFILDVILLENKPKMAYSRDAFNPTWCPFLDWALDAPRAMMARGLKYLVLCF